MTTSDPPIRGTLYILTAPSGAGKTTLAERLIATSDHLQRSISYTTRPVRPGEKSGIHYEFVTETTFKEMVAAGAFLEHAYVHGYYYGTPQKYVEERLSAGIDIILVIDWQGAQQVQKNSPDVVSIFVLPPSQQLLRQRLLMRGQDDTTIIEQRLAAAASEVAHYMEFDYLIVNDKLEHALQDLQTIVRSQHLSRGKQAMRYAKLLAEWLEKR